MQDVAIEGPTRICSATGRELKPGERFFAVLHDENGRLVRRDFALEAWTKPDHRAIAYWMGRVPEADKPRKSSFKDDLLIDCFQRMADVVEEDQLSFRYVLALLLMRRKRLKFEDAYRDEAGRDILLLRDARSGVVHTVIDPQLTEEQTSAVQEEVFRILDMQ